MYQCLQGYGPIQTYVHKALRGLEDRILEIDWEETTPPPPESSTGRLPPRKRLEQELAKLKPRPPEWFWVRLKPPETDEGDEILREFLEAEFVNDVKDRRERHSSVNRVRDSDEETGTLALDHRPRGKTIFLRPNPYGLERQNRALLTLEASPLCHHIPLLRLTEDPSKAVWPPVELIVPTEWFVLTDADRPGTKEERRFVNIALGSPDFTMLIGPPGSGKTISICELIVQQVRRGKRVMLCASTHVAVDNVLEKLIEKGFTETDVIAVRVGDAARISEVTQRFQLNERLATEREALITKLRAVKERSPAQDTLLEALQTDGGDRIVERIILDCSNLVCGTTIGILQHPYIRNNRDASGDPFDMLIVDEVSKTTLQEFLVPALWARRWVLAGDVRQLAPFVEEEDLKANIGALLPPDARRACADVFLVQKQISQRGVEGGFLIEESPSVRELVVRQAELLGLAATSLEGPPTDADVKTYLRLLGSQVVVAPPSIAAEWERYLPHDLANLSNLELRTHHRRHWAHLRSRPMPGEDDPTWEAQIAWRLVRLFEMRNLPSADSVGLENDLKALLPQWYSSGERERLSNDLAQIREMTFPSVLEILESGYRGNAASRTTILARGLPKDVLDARRVELVYQHRMHPDISRFPREQIYEDRLLADLPGIERQRLLPFKIYPAHSHWIHVRGVTRPSRNENRAEVECVRRELERLRRETSAHPPLDHDHHDDMWEVAVLTFYRPQESALRQMLRGLFNQPRRRQHFDDADAHVRVHLATVDRIQGHEADFVYLSFVKTRRVGFLNVPNRLNVAITRAKFQLVLIGDHPFFRNQKQSSILRELAARHERPDISLPLGGE